MTGTLPPILLRSTRKWQATELGVKPVECMSCPFHPYSTGFVGDYVGAEPKLAVMLPFPTRDDVLEQESGKSDMGRWIFKNFIAPIGITYKELIISHVLRCKPAWSKRLRREAYPTGRTRNVAETACRTFDGRHSDKGKLQDGGLLTFDPNIFLITFNPREVFRVPAYLRQIQVDMKKARQFIDEGLRPLVLFGNEAAELVYPWIAGHGSSKTWRGHYSEIEWPYKGNTACGV